KFMDQLVFEHIHLFLQFPFDLLSHVLEDYKPRTADVGRKTSDFGPSDFRPQMVAPSNSRVQSSNSRVQSETEILGTRSIGRHPENPLRESRGRGPRSNGPSALPFQSASDRLKECSSPFALPSWVFPHDQRRQF